MAGDRTTTLTPTREQATRDGAPLESGRTESGLSAWKYQEGVTTVRKHEDGSKDIVLSMGPQHPSTHGVLRLQLRLDGERVRSIDPDIGYLHRSWEKIVERWTYPQVVPFTDRNDYLGCAINEHVFCMAVESLMGLRVPPRAEHIRVILSELQRIASHLLWMGTFALDLGATTAFLWGFREREKVYVLIEMLTGGHLFPQYMRLGGIRSDLPPHFLSSLNQLLQEFPNRLKEYHTLLTDNPIFLSRTKGIGVLTQEDALAYGCSGAMLRGSGIRWDIREADPYSLYGRLKFEVPTGEHGDCFDRYLVRMKEIEESLRIIEQVAERLPDGEILAKTPKVFKPPAGTVYTHVESPRGELGVYLVSNGEKEPYRVKWRSPAFSNLHVVAKFGREAALADLVAILGSIDIVLGEVDR